MLLAFPWLLVPFLGGCFAGWEDECFFEITGDPKPRAFRNNILYVKPFEDVQLECKAPRRDHAPLWTSSYNEPCLRKSRDAADERSCVQERLKTDTSVQRMTIKGMEKHLEGEYTCSAPSANWPCNAVTVTIYVMDPPEVIRPLPSVFALPVRSNETVTLNLSCDCTKTKSIPPSWFLNGKELSQSDSINVLPNGTLQILRAGRMHSGIYMCLYSVGVQQFRSYIEVYGGPFVDKHSRGGSKNFRQSSSGTIECVVYGYPTPSVKWFKAEGEKLGMSLEFLNLNQDDQNLFTNALWKMIEASNRVSFVPYHGVSNARIIFNELNYTDRANYKCEVSPATVSASLPGGISATLSAYHNDRFVQFIRVKDKMAALWPFLGIVAEFIILAVIIFVYEKRRKAKEREELESDMADKRTTGSNTPAGTELRQRKH